MLNGKRFSGTAHTGHDFVGDEEDSAIAADFCDAFCVTVGRCGGSERGSNYGFEDEGGHGFGIVRGEEGFEIVSAG